MRKASPSPKPHAYGAGQDPTVRAAPGFSFGAPLPVDHKTPSPGPIYNLETGVSRTGLDHGRTFQMRGRAKDRRPSHRPSPASYEVTPGTRQVLRHSPSYTFGSRLDSNPSRLPGPCDYSPGLSTGGPSPSFGLRPEAGGFMDLGSRGKNPGPGRYCPLEKGDGTPTSPKFSIGLPAKSPTLRPHPGPADHFPETCQLTKPRSPTFKMGPPGASASLDLSHSGKSQRSSKLTPLTTSEHSASA